VYVFHYDRLSRAYLGAEPCEFDQREPGRVIVPAWATAKPPPPDKPGCVRVFNTARDEWQHAPEGPVNG
jgi:hypothetical protein